MAKFLPLVVAILGFLLLTVSLWQVLSSTTPQVAEVQREDIQYRRQVQTIPESINIETRYGVVFDLGSSGSRANIFTWERDIFGDCAVNKGGGFRNMKPDKYKKIKPGISQQENTPSSAGESLSELWRFLEESIPSEKHAETPIFMFATAGLRVISERDDEKLYDDDDADGDAVIDEDDDAFDGKVNQLLHHLRIYVRERTTFQLLKREHIRVLTGSEEGLFDFLTLQQLVRSNPTGKLSGTRGTSEFTLFDKQFSGLNGPLYPLAVIDLGGASTQLSMATDDPELTSYNVTVFSAGTEIMQQKRTSMPGSSMYSRSFLDYGINRAYELYQANLLKNHSLSGERYIYDHCFFSGGSYILNDAAKGESHSIIGMPDVKLCKDAIVELFNDFSGLCKDQPCAMVNVPKPRITKDTYVVAFDHAYRVASFFNSSGNANLFTLTLRVKDLFEFSWRDVIARFPENSALELQKIPFEGLYVFTLLWHGYGIPTGGNSLVAFADMYDGHALSWALGALLFNANALCSIGLM